MEGDGNAQVFQMPPAVTVQRKVFVRPYPEQADSQIVFDEVLVLESVVCILDGLILHGGYKDIPQPLYVAFLAVFLECHEVGLHSIDDRDTVVVLGDGCRDAETFLEFRADGAAVLVRDAPVEDGENGERIEVCDTATIGVIL